MPEKTTKTPPTHYLKTWPEFFDAIRAGCKTFEIRKNDRGFQAGDRLVLRKWDPREECYVREDGKRVHRHAGAESLDLTITYVLSGFGLEHGYVAIGFRPR
jgi:hypothetical protein